VVRVYDNDKETEIGSITEAQFDLLQEELVEDTIDACTYSVSAASIDSLKLNGADDGLIALLRGALGARSSMELRFDLD